MSVRTKSRCVGRRVAVEMVDTDDLVVGAGSEVATIRGKSNGMNGSEMVAHVAELSGFRVVSVMGVEDGLDGPDADMAISAGGS